MRTITSRRLGTCALAATAALLALAGPAAAGNNPAINRLFGPDRYGTAQAVAQTDWGTAGATIAVMASGLNYPDALSANYLAGRVHGPVLLTDPNSLSSGALNGLKAVKATGVDVIGGTAAVSDNVVSQLKADGYTVNRISGPDRYGTAEAVDTVFPASFVGDLGSAGPTAVVATGLGFADALAAGGMCDAAAFPLVLTDPNSLPSSSAAALQTDKIKNVVIVGGTAAVSNAVATQIQNMGITVTRIAGADRTDTAAQLAEKVEIPQLGFTNTLAVLARGDDYPDALSGGPHSGLNKTPIVLTENPNALGTYTTAWFQSHNTTLTRIDVLGGTSAVSDSAANAAQAAG